MIDQCLGLFQQRLVVLHVAAKVCLWPANHIKLGQRTCVSLDIGYTMDHDAACIYMCQPVQAAMIVLAGYLSAMHCSSFFENCLDSLHAEVA